MAEHKYQSALDKLDDLAQLKHGWDYGQGKPFHSETISRAKEILTFFPNSFDFASVFPGSDGEIHVDFGAPDFDEIKTDWENVKDGITVTVIVKQGFDDKWSIEVENSSCTLIMAIRGFIRDRIGH